MARVDENLIFQSHNVRYKRTSGTLYVRNDRIEWMAEKRKTLQRYFSHMEKVRIPEGISYLLQVVMNDETDLVTFHFCNSEDRDYVKSLLESLMPNFQRENHPERDRRNNILRTSRRLRQMYAYHTYNYKLMTHNQFWRTYEYVKQQSTEKNIAQEQESTPIDE